MTWVRVISDLFVFSALTYERQGRSYLLRQNVSAGDLPKLYRKAAGLGAERDSGAVVRKNGHFQAFWSPTQHPPSQTLMNPVHPYHQMWD